MLDFLANNVEQLDVALEHALLGDANNARFALMMTDNAVEITLHQTAVDAQMMSRLNWYRDEEYEHGRELEAAFGNDFGAKVAFAGVLGRFNRETAETIRIGHRFRNEVYHLGVQHESVLPVVSRFYLEVACDVLAGYEPPFISYGSDTRLPPRALSHLGKVRHFDIEGLKTRYRTACASLGARARVPPAEFANGLADHLAEVVEAQDMAIETIATGGPRKMTREEAIMDAMAGSVAFSERGKGVAGKSGLDRRQRRKVRPVVGRARETPVARRSRRWVAQACAIRAGGRKPPQGVEEIPQLHGSDGGGQADSR